jgi:glycerol kinase
MPWKDPSLLPELWCSGCVMNYRSFKRRKSVMNWPIRWTMPGELSWFPLLPALGAPHWDPFARGAAFGLSRATNRAHLCRAALESIAFQCIDLIRAMEKDSGDSIKELRVDGGASRSQPLLQFQADLLQEDVIRPDSIETTALGAAYLAGLGSGFYQDREEIVENWTEGARFSPRADADSMQEKIRSWHEAVERTKNWIPASS